MQGGKRSSVDARVDIQAPTCIFVATHLPIETGASFILAPVSPFFVTRFPLIPIIYLKLEEKV